MKTQIETRIQFPSCVYYVPSRAAIVDSLFTPGGTASGHYKVGKHGVTFYDIQGNPEFFLAAHRSNKFFVSCHRVQISGKNRTRYLYALDSLTEAKLGIDKMGHCHEHNFAESVWQSVKA